MCLKRLTADDSARPRPLLLCLLAFLPTLAGCSSYPWEYRVLYAKSGTLLYVEHQEKDAKEVPLGYLHPVRISAEKMRALLSQVVYKYRPLIGKDEDKLLFSAEEVAALSAPMALASGTLTPNERLRFLVMRDNWTSAFTGPKATSGVLFVEKGGVLNFALDRIRENVSVGEGGGPESVSFSHEPTEYRRADALIPFPGTELHVDAETGQRFPRWLEVRVATLTYTPPGPAPVAATAPVTGTAPPAPAKEPGATDDTRYSKLKARLKDLKRLKAEGLLTDEEYQAQFEKIMSEL